MAGLDDPSESTLAELPADEATHLGDEVGHKLAGRLLALGIADPDLFEEGKG
jgi:hypothetical protein